MKRHLAVALCLDSSSSVVFFSTIARGEKPATTTDVAGQKTHLAFILLSKSRHLLLYSLLSKEGKTCDYNECRGTKNHLAVVHPPFFNLRSSPTDIWMYRTPTIMSVLELLFVSGLLVAV